MILMIHRGRWLRFSSVPLNGVRVNWKGVKYITVQYMNFTLTVNGDSDTD